MVNGELFQPIWQTKKLIVCNVIAVFLLGLWAWPLTHNIGMQFDTAFFKLLNGSLAYSDTWAALWALTSIRYFDLLVGLILLLLLINGHWLFKSQLVRQAFFALVVLMLLQVVIRIFFTKFIHGMNWQHSSPSILVDDAFRLSQHFPSWEDKFEIKDRSSRSFPGDHASVLLIWAFFLSQFARKFLDYFIIWFVAILFMLPRLVAGAHWASDDYIGGVILSLLALGWGFYTPFAARLSELLVNVTLPLFRWLRKIPIINRLNIIRYPE